MAPADPDARSPALTRLTCLIRPAALIALAALLTGCPDRHRKPDTYSEDPATILAKLDARASAIRSLTAQLKLEVWQDGERVKLRQLVAVQSPDKLRIDLLSPFEQPLVTLTSDGAVLSIYDLEKKRFSRGAASNANLARLLPIKLAPDSLAGLLRGTIPIIKHTSAKVSWDGENGWYQLDLEGPERRQRIHVEPQAWRITQAREWLGDAQVYTARLGDYSSVGDTALPRRMRLTAPNDVKVDAVVEDHQVNMDLPAEAFVLDPPEGIPIEPLE